MKLARVSLNTPVKQPSVKLTCSLAHWYWPLWVGWRWIPVSASNSLISASPVLIHLVSPPSSWKGMETMRLTARCQTRIEPLSLAAIFSAGVSFPERDRSAGSLSRLAPLRFTNTSVVSSSVLLASLAVLPTSQILDGTRRRVRGHQPIGHPLVDQGGVGGHRTQQHRSAPVQHQSYTRKGNDDEEVTHWGKLRGSCDRERIFSKGGLGFVRSCHLLWLRDRWTGRGRTVWMGAPSFSLPSSSTTCSSGHLTPDTSFHWRTAVDRKPLWVALGAADSLYLWWCMSSLWLFLVSLSKIRVSHAAF